MADYHEPLHPKTGKPLTNIDRIAFRLNILWGETAYSLRAMLGSVAIPEDNPYRDDIRFVLDNAATIVVAKFLEILASMRRETQDARIPRLLNAIEPITRRIEIWPGFKELRDQVLAHAYLVKDRTRIVNPAELLARGEAPGNSAEIAVLLVLTEFAITVCIEAIFDDFWDVVPIVSVDSATPPSLGVTDSSQVPAEVQRVIDEAVPGIREAGIDPFGRTHRQGRRTLGPDFIRPGSPEWLKRREERKAQGLPVPKPPAE